MIGDISMDLAQRLVVLSLESQGYFVMEGIKAGRKEADILALLLDNKGDVVERLHVEVHVNSHPIGLLRGKGRIESGKTPAQCADEFIDKKFLDSQLVATIEARLGSSKYKRILVHGRLKDRSQLEILKARGIQCAHLNELIENALRGRPVAEFKRIIEITRLESDVPRSA